MKKRTVRERMIAEKENGEIYDVESKAYDEEQLSCVRECEAVFAFGLGRNRQLSGMIAAGLLQERLENHIAGLTFNNGIVYDTNVQKIGKYKTTETVTSREIDIIAYRGKPLYRFGNIAFVEKEQAVLCIEVKKWFNSKKGAEEQKKHNDEVRAKLPGIEIFVVGFREAGCINKTEVGGDDYFGFSNGSAKIDASACYSGELKRLVDAISMRLKRR